MLLGQLITGFSVSLTVTVNEQVAMLPAASVAVACTVVTPFAKVEPDAMSVATVTPGQLSAAVSTESNNSRAKARIVTNHDVGRTTNSWHCIVDYSHRLCICRYVAGSVGGFVSNYGISDREHITGRNTGAGHRNAWAVVVGYCHAQRRVTYDCAAACCAWTSVGTYICRSRNGRRYGWALSHGDELQTRCRVSCRIRSSVKDGCRSRWEDKVCRHTRAGDGH